MDAEEVNERPWEGRPWDGQSVCVAGLGVSGRAAARVLAARGARVTIVDARDGEEQRGHAAELEARGVAVRLGDGESLPADAGLVSTARRWASCARPPASARSASV
ncbi:hypothetical protein AB0K37_41935, partial [Actinomadura sp. NPDC049753]